MDPNSLEAKACEQYIKFENKIANRKLFLVCAGAHCLLSLVLGLWSSLSGDFLLTDAFPFYFSNALIVFAGGYGWKVHSTKIILGYLVVYMVLLVSASFGAAKLYSDRVLAMRICDFELDDCDEDIPPRLLMAIVRNGILMISMGVALHPMVSYFLLAFSEIE